METPFAFGYDWFVINPFGGFPTLRTRKPTTRILGWLVALNDDRQRFFTNATEARRAAQDVLAAGHPTEIFEAMHEQTFDKTVDRAAFTLYVQDAVGLRIGSDAIRPRAGTRRSWECFITPNGGPVGADLPLPQDRLPVELERSIRP